MIKPVKPPVPAAVRASPLGFIKAFFSIEPVRVNSVAHEEMESEKHAKLLRIVLSESLTIVLLVAILIFGTPFFKPIYKFYALNPTRETMPLVDLPMPNMTNQAILSWATSSITEVMTIGFGDFEPKLIAQKPRFTKEGWDAFVRAFLKQKVGESFKQSQLVLTTVPSNTPVILFQGENEEHIYAWHVQMPVVMTYATNNNKNRRENAIIELTIVRVPTDQSSTGIAIKTWSLQ